MQGLLTQEVGLAYGHSLFSERIGLGANLRAVYGMSYHTFIQYDDITGTDDLIDDVTDSNNRETSQRVALDVGHSYEILPDSRPYLDEVGRMLNLKGLVDKRLVIVGHTDASGSGTYNLKLSKRRAEEIRSYLVANHRVDHARLQALGRGESEPLRGNDPFDARNRRVEFRSAK